MSRQLKELKNFNVGNVTNADSREVPDEAAAMSQNIDPNAPNGILKGNYQEDYKGGNINFSKYLIDTGIETDGSTNNTDSTHTLTSVEGLVVGDWVSIGAYAWKIVSINSATNVITVGATRAGAFTGTVAISTGTAVYKIPTPKQLVSYVTDVSDSKENVIIFDEEGSINGIENLSDTESGQIGEGINTVFNSNDFSGFPLNIKHDGDISIAGKGLSYFLGTGKGTKSKWLGKVGKLALSNSDGFILEDSELYPPDFGTGSNAYDKVITYQYTTTSSATLVKMPRINNETGVFHVAFIKGEQWLYIIDGDSGFVNRSIDVGFPITAIAKVISCITDARIWLYEEISDLTTFETKPGKIHCYEIFDFGVTDSIDLKSLEDFPIGVPLTFKHQHDCHWGQTYAEGYPSEPMLSGQDDQTGNNHKPLTVPEVSDILETVDSSGNGKLWILASPQSDENPYQEWFRTSRKLETDDMILHRFIWASYSNIDGDLANGSTVITYFNDKSMPLPAITDYKSGLTQNGGSHNYHEDGFDRLGMQITGDVDECYYTTRTMKRSVPGGSAYTPPANNVDDGFQDILENTDLSTDSENRLYSIVHGGSFWYYDPQNKAKISGDDNKLFTHLDWTDIIRKDSGPNERTSDHNKILENIGSQSGPYFEKVPFAAFKPMPYSLVDVSDLYDGVDHVVACVVKVSDETNMIYLEDAWTKHHLSVGKDEVIRGLRLHGMGGKSFLWITNAGINNYGALYSRSNTFGYRTHTGGDAASLDGINLSTLCFDKNDDVVRQIKVIGEDIPDSGITSIARNKATHEYNVFQEYNDRDSRFSALFITYKPENSEEQEDELPKGVVVRLNTTVEQADTIDGVTDYNGNEVVIIGDHESVLGGYANHEGTAGSVGIIDNAGITDTELYPINQNAIAQANGAVTTITNNSSLTVEALNGDAYSGGTFAGLHSGTPEAPNEVFPDGPGVISYFDTDNFFRKVWYNRSSATTLSNLYTEAEHGIADNRAIILRSDGFQKGFSIDQGPYEANGDIIPANGTVTKYGKIFNVASASDMTPSNIDILDTKETIVSYVWAKGAPSKNDGTDASDEGRRSQYGANNYQFTFSNQGGKNNTYYGGLSSIVTGSTARINTFGPNGSSDREFKMYINRLYQYTKDAILEFTDGEDDTESESANFPNDVTRYYRLSYEYDGYQDSPMTTSIYAYKNTSGTNKSNVKIKIRIPLSVSPRVSAVTLYRRGGLTDNTEGAFYFKVDRIPFLKGSGWSRIPNVTGEAYEFTVNDTLITDEDYTTYTRGMPTYLLNTNINYGISVVSGDRLFVADFNSNLTPEGTNSIAWSKLGSYSQFDVMIDRLDFDESITALANFNNILFAFSLTKIYKIDPSTQTIVDVIEGFGCSNKDAVVSTEYGMFFADTNHIYHYDGSQVKILSFAIDIDANGTDGWSDVATNTNFRMYFLNKFNLLTLVVKESSVSSVSEIYTYHILKQRWDIKRPSIKNSDSSFSNQVLLNNLLLPSKLGGNVYAFIERDGKGDQAAVQASKLIELNKSDEESSQFYWESKDFTMGMDTTDKRFIKLKIEASAALTTTPLVYVDGLLNTLTSSGTNEWKIKKNSGTGASQKGKKIMVKLNTGNDNKEIYSMGIIYRTLKVK